MEIKINSTHFPDNGYRQKGRSNRGNVAFGNSAAIINAAEKAKGIFAADAEVIADKKTMEIFSKYYGKISRRVQSKLIKLQNEGGILKRGSRFEYKNGAFRIWGKKVLTSLKESALFPFFEMPVSLLNKGLKKAQNIPALKDTAKNIYKTSFFRVPRKFNEIDTKTDILKGMAEKTQTLVSEFAEKKGITAAELTEKLTDKTQGDTPLVREAEKYLRESLYKASNKFFDKNTGNFNTAHERPLNRIVTGMIPVWFLANDAYNLSVLCGDKKEDSIKEANIRKKQEISRIFTTAYFQLIIFGAFTRQVNKMKWFAPLTGGLTVLVSEFTSRIRHGRPVFFLSKEKAKERNRKKGENAEVAFKNNNKTSSMATESQKIIYRNMTATDRKNDEAPSVFAGFTSNAKPVKDKNSGTTKTFTGEKADKDEPVKKSAPRKALINFQTFKKCVGILIGAGFLLSIIKNSSLTKDSFLVKKPKELFDAVKKKIYDPLTSKEFEMPVKKYEKIMDTLNKVDCGEVAEGHDFIKNTYAKVENGIIKIYRSKLKDGNIPAVTEFVQQQIEKSGTELNGTQAKIISDAIRTSIEKNKTLIAENKFGDIADFAEKIVKKKQVDVNSELLKESLIKSLKENAKVEAVKTDRLCKPFVDVFIQPFKFIWGAVKKPFEITTLLIKLPLAGVLEKADKVALGDAVFTDAERTAYRIYTEIYGQAKAKENKISQKVFTNAMEHFEKQTSKYIKLEEALNRARQSGSKEAVEQAAAAFDKEKERLMIYVKSAVEKSFNGVTQSSNKNTDLALMSKLVSSTVTSAFLVADNYNMVMLKSDGEDKDGAKEKANERIIQRLSGLFYQALFIHWFNATFKSLYNSSLLGMAAVAAPNTLTTEIITRKSIGMPICRKTIDELNAIDEKNENRKGFAGKYYEFMRLLTGKKPLKERLPKDKQKISDASAPADIKSVQQNVLNYKVPDKSTNMLERFTTK